MATGVGYSIDGIVPGAPVVLVFGREGGPSEARDHAGLFRRLAESHRRPVGRLSLRDRGRAGYHRGVDGLGATIDETAAALKPLLAVLGTGPIITFGAGIGGHAALVFGALVGAARVVAFEPPSTLDPDQLALYNDRRWARELSEPPDPAEARRYDVPGLFNRTGFAGQACILFGTHSENPHPEAVRLDVVHAHRLALSSRVTLCPLREARGPALDWLASRPDAGRLLAHFLFGDVRGPDFSRAIPRPDPAELARRRTKVRDVPIRIVREDRPGVPRETIAFAVAGVADDAPLRDVGNEWRRQIAEALMLDEAPRAIAATIVAAGYTEREAYSEIHLASVSPYLRGSRLLRDRLAKRDWLLATLRKLRRLHSGSDSIERRHRLSRNSLINDYVTANRPVIVTGMLGKGLGAGWSIDDLARRFGDVSVSLEASALAGAQGAAGGEGPATAPLSDVVAAIRAGDERRLGSIDLGLLEDDGEAAIGPWGDAVVYLAPGDRSCDLLRVFPAGTSVPEHETPADALLAQMAGRTRVRIMPSWEVPLLPDPLSLSAARSARPRALEFVLEPGEVLFVPEAGLLTLAAPELAVIASSARLDVDSGPEGPDSESHLGGP